VVGNPRIHEEPYLSSSQTMLANPKVMNLGKYSICRANLVVESSILPIPLASSDTDLGYRSCIGLKLNLELNDSFNLFLPNGYIPFAPTRPQ
jgi:hypothetical protein